MNRIYFYICTICSVCLLGTAVTACSDKEEGGINEGLSVRVYTPTKVMEGLEVVITGTGLDRVTSVIFPGEVKATSIDVTSPNEIRVITPAGIAPEGGELKLEAEGEVVVARVPMVIGVPQISSLSPGDEAGVGKELLVVGTDMEFFSQAIFPGENGDVVVNAIDFERKSTSLLRVKVPKGIREGRTQIKLVTIAGTEMLLPEIQLNAQADGEWVITETTAWEGEFDLGSWSNNFEIQAACFEGVQTGQKIKFYFKQNGEAQFKFNTGEWAELSLPEVGGSTVTTDFLGGEDVGEFEFAMTDELLNPWFTTGDSWGNGNAIIINGENVTFTKITIVKEEFVEGGGSSGNEVKLWEGTTEPIGWNENGKIELGSDALEQLAPGKKLGIGFECDPDAGYWQVRIMGTWWTELPTPQADWTDPGNKVMELTAEDTKYEFTLAQDDIDILVEQGGLLLGGNGLIIKSVYLK